MTGQVKDMIRAIRSCKTPAEERAVIARECADIRSALNSNSSSERRKNIAKLLLIHLMGHNTNFGQVECIKLIASPKFADKRVGYLSLSILLNEDAEVLTLAINSIKRDLNGNNAHAAEAALNALANIGNSEMFRELYQDLERLIKAPAVNIRKKTIVCSARMLRKLGQASLVPGPEVMEIASTHYHNIPALLCDHNHGVVAAALTLLDVIIDFYPKCCNFQAIYELLIKTLNALSTESAGGIGVMFGGGKDYEINGVNDPFLKVKLLGLIRKVYGRRQDQTAENQQLYDTVCHVLKSVTVSNNATHSLLYECVRTIYNEMHDPKFNQLGREVVHKFISTNDNNIKYIALGILNNLSGVTLTVGDNNWTIIVQSLRQPDISIRRRSLDVTLKLMSKETVRPLMQHLYDFLLAASDELKRESVTKIAAALERHADSELEIMVKIFAIAGNSVSEAILHSFIAAVGASTTDTQIRITTKLYYVLPNNLGQDALVRAALWCLGEYTHVLPELNQIDVTPSSAITAKQEPPATSKLEFEDLIGVTDDLVTGVETITQLETTPVAIGNENTAMKVIAVVESVARHILACSGAAGHDCTNGEYLLTCLGKLACRVPKEIDRIMRVVRQFKKHTNTELQQRASEMDVLFEQRALHVLLSTEGDHKVSTTRSPTLDFSSPLTERKAEPPKPTQGPLLGDDLLGLGEVVVPKPAPAEKLDTLDFMTFDYSAKDNTTKKNNDEFGEFDPF
ncbi:AP-1 complex subunit gamma [Babesia sp. Xinjiang]|uniref:AP-1 complex subunit gamma n=1 Tax=Babesia sp. Xinjiang TaxID=462227 RepID=UPI000A2563B8|nr:AP-1 complex subunit gamma [Babesia sp. Xinjiang]ORM40783.1 AP-1 complex subunit gamma [Babesia sp. Xinjiang]